MLNLLWGLLNAVLVVSFIIIYVKAIKLVKEKMGIMAAIVFTLGLLSYLSFAKVDSENLEPNSSSIKTWRFIASDSLVQNSIQSVDTVFEKPWVLTYRLSVRFGKDKQAKTVVESANTSTSGLIMGTSWKPIYITVTPTEDNKKFAYYIEGIIKWKLLGITLYSQNKSWKGFVVAK